MISSDEAVAAKQLKIVNFILQTCPSLSLKQSFDVVDAVLDNPDPAILKALCDHEKNFASFSIDYHIHCFLTAACARPPAEIVPVLHVLLDNGGDVNDGQGSGGGALYAAIVGNQPLEIIKKVVSKGADVNFRCTGLAIEQGSLETVKYLFASGKIRYSFQVDATFEKAKKSGHAETIAAVQSWACERVERDAKSEEKATTKSNWQFWESWYG